MRIDRRLVGSIAAALATVQAASAAALAATGTPPAGYEAVADQVNFGPIGITVATLVILTVVIVAAWRRGWGRLIAAIASLVLSGFGALTVVAVGMFSDWSDAGSNIPVPYVIGAIAVLAAGIFVAGRILFFGGRKRTAESPDPAVLR